MNIKKGISRGLASLLIGAGSLCSPAVNSYSYADEPKAQVVQEDKSLTEKTAESLRTTYITLFDYVKQDKIAEQLEKSEPKKYQALINLENNAEEAFHIKDFSTAQTDYSKAICELTKALKPVLKGKTPTEVLIDKKIFAHITEYKELMFKTVEDNINQKNYQGAKEILESNEEAFMDTYMCNAEMRNSAKLTARISYCSGETEKHCRKIFGEVIEDKVKNPLAGEITIKSGDKTLNLGYSLIDTIQEPESWNLQAGDKVELWVNKGTPQDDNKGIYVMKLNNSK
ncbi:MAG: hypothetical protein WC781_04320 [Candidatus Pacearchaeota archaeon]|jgi:hypothetical protein